MTDEVMVHGSAELIVVCPLKCNLAVGATTIETGILDQVLIMLDEIAKRVINKALLLLLLLLLLPLYQGRHSAPHYCHNVFSNERIAGRQVSRIAVSVSHRAIRTDIFVIPKTVSAC